MGKGVKTIHVLRAARKLVADERTWTASCGARDARGLIAIVDDETSVAWCAWGAVERECRLVGLSDNEAAPLHNSLDRIAMRDHDVLTLYSVNDALGRLAALSVIDAAIAELNGK